MKVNWLMVLPVLLTLGFFGIAGVQLMTNQDALQHGVDTTALRSAQQGHAAPGLALEPLAGTPTPLLIDDDLRGNGLIMVNFWASWCPPCRAEHPTLTALARTGTPLYGINYRDQEDHALGFLEELGNPYDRIGRDDAARNGRNWGVVAMPETFFINDAGVVVYHFRGPVTRRALETQIIPALETAGHNLTLPAPVSDSNG
ncbi:DsbE family thiol:disulfide interchange protein [Rhodophyticola sp. CCM32]|uniref:DsbE family thiol:disulfide interchange protein n=1 Tax=Rhodophyticola sp. CCM32 TaxID=2916397 RepID=UPI00107EEB2E|nr:DsbE family thiol:disulfide interchange protein [Rhodophyticola sp. CCM32]QBY00043.1 DsbE family thiol:disulfide interchange protein [Rhodophyticola sp. CCM32]